MTSYFQDGSHGVISSRKVLCSDWETKCLPHTCAAVPVSSWSVVHSYLLKCICDSLAKLVGRSKVLRFGKVFRLLCGVVEQWLVHHTGNSYALVQVLDIWHSQVPQVVTVCQYENCHTRKEKKLKCLFSVDGSWIHGMTSVKSVWRSWEMSGHCIVATPSWTAPRLAQKSVLTSYPSVNPFYMSANYRSCSCPFMTLSLRRAIILLSKTYGVASEPNRQKYRIWNSGVHMTTLPMAIPDARILAAQFSLCVVAGWYILQQASKEVNRKCHPRNINRTTENCQPPTI